MSLSITRPAAWREFVLALAASHQRGEAFAAGVASAMLLMPPRTTTDPSPIVGTSVDGSKNLAKFEHF